MSNDPADPDGAIRRFRELMGRRQAPAETIAEMEAATSLHPRRRRAFQAELMARAFRDAAELAAGCGWSGRVVISGGKVVVDQDGALLSADSDNRYFRANGPPAGAAMLDALKRLGVEPRAILDVGANIGELSIYFARRLPQARIIAFEPAPENIADFRANLALQSPPLTNLELVTEAVSDRSGAIAFTVGAADLNTTMVEANLERLNAGHDVRVVEVPGDTLESLCARLGVGHIDFLKVDTEGGEPRLAGSIRAMAGRIGAAFVEISVFNTLDAYAELADAFASIGLVMADKKLARVTAPRPWLAERLSRARAVNVWFAAAEALA